MQSHAAWVRGKRPFAHTGATTETDYDAKVLGQADRAIALAPDNARAYWVKSGYLMLTRRPNEALRAADAQAQGIN